MTTERSTALKAAFGSDAAAFEQNLVDAAKVHFDAYKYKVTAQAPVYASRSLLAKKIKHFWSKALNNAPHLAQFIDPVDEDALTFLEDVEIVHDKEDPREWEIKFSFSGKNPYFSEKVLVKKFTIKPPSSITPTPPTPSPHDLEADIYSLRTPISWTSPEHNLILKAPRTNIDEQEEFDEFGGPGSFFNLFEEEGEDEIGLSELLLEWFGHATEYAAGLSEIDGQSSSDEGFDEFDSEDEEDDEVDPKKEIDLESDEEGKRPKKKSKKA